VKYVILYINLSKIRTNLKEKKMTGLELKVVNKNGDIIDSSNGINEVHLVIKKFYEEGDKVILESDCINTYMYVQIDDALGPAFVYITKNSIEYEIPFHEKRVSYSPKVFYGDIHYLYARVATKEEIQSYKNLSLNVMDRHGDTGYYPHASANVETRGEAVFAARNAIDGVRENRDHGVWPYESWGINRRDDANMRVSFGRNVVTDKILLYTRADFPHDNWWVKVTLTFSDGTSIDWDLEKSSNAHVLNFEPKTTQWVELSNLIKSEDPSPFPALTQIEVYGREA
jgi:hypothetical protein